MIESRGVCVSISLRHVRNSIRDYFINILILLGFDCNRSKYILELYI